MFKITDTKNIREMGFKKIYTEDYVYCENVDGGVKRLFTVYAGSPYLRYSKSSYVNTNQLRCIYEWTKKNYIEWED